MGNRPRLLEQRPQLLLVHVLGHLWARSWCKTQAVDQLTAHPPRLKSKKTQDQKSAVKIEERRGRRRKKARGERRSFENRGPSFASGAQQTKLQFQGRTAAGRLPRAADNCCYRSQCTLSCARRRAVRLRRKSRGRCAWLRTHAELGFGVRKDDMQV